MSFNKRASLEISIQAIVIVVLAMTLLGLGLGFIRGMFRNIGGISEDVTEQVKNKILDDLIQGDKKVSFPKTTIEIDKGGSEVFTIGIRNKKDTTLHYHMIFTPVNFVSSNTGAPEVFSISSPPWFQTGEPPDGYVLGASESDVRNIRLRVPTNNRAGSYVLTFNIIDTEVPPPDDIYAQKDFFIVVRG